MSLLDDPSMKEIVIEFCHESTDLIDELESILEEIEEEIQDNPNAASKLEKYGQIVDRIMGAAKSIGATDVAKLSELGKAIGYKSSQVKDAPLIEIVVAILFDSLVIMRKLLKDIEVGNKNNLNQLNTKAFVTRLNWLSEKFKDIERSSCAIDESPQTALSSIEDLMKSLGL